MLGTIKQIYYKSARWRIIVRPVRIFVRAFRTVADEPDFHLFHPFYSFKFAKIAIGMSFFLAFLSFGYRIIADK